MAMAALNQLSAPQGHTATRVEVAPNLRKLGQMEGIGGFWGFVLILQYAALLLRTAEQDQASHQPHSDDLRQNLHRAAS